MGRSDVLKSLKPEAFADEKFGAITIKDILVELDKPGRDPRPDFKVARFNDGVEDIKDLQPGMLLEGTVSNVAQFGAFVDLGVHQDGLVHVSQLSNKFVNDAREVVKTGDIVKVKVVEVDLARQRIALTMKLDTQPQPKGARQRRQQLPRAGAQRAPGAAASAAARRPRARRPERDGRGLRQAAGQGLTQSALLRSQVASPNSLCRAALPCAITHAPRPTPAAAVALPPAPPSRRRARCRVRPRPRPPSTRRPTSR